MNSPENFKNRQTLFLTWTSVLSILILLVLGTLALSAALLITQIENGIAPLQLINDFLALDSIHIWWYISRAAGLVGYLLIWLSTIWGFAVGSKIFDSLLERYYTYDFHEHLSILGLGFMGLHAIVLLFDKFEPLSLTEILVPFVSSYRAFWTGIGIIAFYLSILVTVTFYLRNRISIRTFRRIHYLSITAFAGSLFHGLYAGTDSSLQWVQFMYWGTFLSTVFFGIYWLVSVKLGKRHQRNQQLPA